MHEKVILKKFNWKAKNINIFTNEFLIQQMKIQLTLNNVKAFYLGSGGKGGAPLSLIPEKQIQIDMKWSNGLLQH